MKKQRKHYTPEEKVAILRRHLLEKQPISKLCDFSVLRDHQAVAEGLHSYAGCHSG